MSSLKGKNAVVFGGSGSIGSAIVRELVTRECYTVAVARDIDKLIALQKSFVGRKPMFLQADVTERSEVEGVLGHFNQIGRKIWAVIYAVGHCPPSGFVEEASTPMNGISGKKFREYLCRYPEGFHNVAQRMFLEMMPGGSMLAVGSAVTRFNANSPIPPKFHPFHYAAAQVGLDMVIEGYRHSPETKRKKIRFHLIKPAAVDTPFHHDTPPDMRPPALLSINEVVTQVLAALESNEHVTKLMVAGQPSS